VLDKFQVRATGPIDPLTRQPVKGRKKHGGVRFGEMERDSLISHGTSALLADRLLKCSDACEDWVCPECGSILSYAHSPETVKRYSGREAAAQAPICRACSTERGIEVRCAAVTLPYVFRYMSAEFASMNIRLRLRVQEDY
ncbi:DNA-directed RNA polymerase I subunit RPA2, partial [Perkinsus olseni]